MKRRLLTCGALLLAATAQRADAQLALENFNGGTLPTGWVLISDGHTVSPSAFNTNAALVAGLNAAAWMPFQVLATGNYSMITTSNFTTPVQADRWLITPSFTVTSDKMVFKWSDYNLGSNDKLQVWVSPTAGTTAAAFTTKLSDAIPGSTSSPLTSHAVSLSAYNGMTIRMAFRENTPSNGNNWGFIVDDVQTAVLPNKVDGTLTSVSPAASHPTAYGLVSSNVSIKGVVTNNGAAVINNFNINYQQGTGAIKTYAVSGANIQPLSTFSFTHSTPFTIPAINSYPIKVWIDIPSDEVRTNDSGNTSITGVPRMGTKKLVVEEATGTWCGWCVRGIVFMDSLNKLHPNNVSLIAVHNSDPMVVSSYDSWMGTKISGYPSVVIDRREVADPSDIVDAYNAEGSYFAFADITLGAATKTATTFSLPVTINPATNLNGDYRLAIVMTENNVSGTGDATWGQHNYYSSASQKIHLYEGSTDYYNLPAIIPASQMKYNYVARDISPSVTGSTGSLPTSMTAGTNYTATITGTLSSAWSSPNMKAVVLLLNGTNGYILNSSNRNVSLGVNNTQAGLDGLVVYPNPAQENATVSFNLAQASNVQVEVIDALGRVVNSQSQQMTAGAQKMHINVADLATGVYSVNVRTEGGSVTERLSVVK